MATAKQISFINSLLGERELTLGTGQTVEQIREQAETLSVEQASKWIERLLSLPKKESTPRRATFNSDRFVEAGMYRDGETVIRVYFGQQSGRMLAKKLVEHGDHWDWEYLGLAARFVAEETPRLSIEEAAKFGRMTGTCAVCARRLDVPESVERGIGPVCFGRMETDTWLTPKQIARLAEEG